MTFDEALTELGLTSSTDAATARRAYLKLVKTRKPETDSTGFQRARAAYERITAQLEGGAQNFVHAVAATRSTQQPASQGIDGFRAELAALPPGSSVEAALSIARRAVAALPASEEALHWLVQALVAADRSGDAVEALRAAAAAVPMALLQLALRFPTSLTEAELEALGASAPLDVLWQLAETFCNLDLGPRAASAALLAFDAQSRDVAAPRPDPRWVGMLVIRLHEAGAPEPARRVSDRYLRWIEEEDLVEAFKGAPVGQRWAMVVELGQLPDDLPRLARSPLARAVAEGSANLQHAFSEFARYDPAAALKARDAIRAHCPLIARDFGREIAALKRPGLVVRFAGKATLYGLASAPILGFIYLLIAEPLDAYLAAVAREKANTPGARALQSVERTCSRPRPLGETICPKARDAASALGSGGCPPSLKTDIAALLALAKGLSPKSLDEEGYRNALQSMVGELNVLQRAACPTADMR